MKKVWSSFGNAFNGIRLVIVEERNARIHLAAAVCAIILGLILHLSANEWLFICIAIGMVLTAETFNTSLEELCDMLRTTHDPHVAKIKDLAAGAVMLSSMAAAVIGVVIFLPHLLL